LSYAADKQQTNKQKQTDKQKAPNAPTPTDIVGGGNEANHVYTTTYNGKRLHESWETWDAETVSRQVEQAGIEGALAADMMSSQHPRTVSIRREQHVQQSADVIVVTATQ